MGFCDVHDTMENSVANIGGVASSGWSACLALALSGVPGSFLEWSRSGNDETSVRAVVTSHLS
jgi:hypothetical protein